MPFRYQHDAHRSPNGTYTLFDNHSSDFDVSGVQTTTKNIRLAKNHTATLVRQYAHPGGTGIHSVSQGNMQLLPHGNRFVGWGNSPYFTMYSPTGTVLLDGFIAAQPFQSYRAFHAQWTGAPSTSPRSASTRPTACCRCGRAYNGETRVAAWRITFTGASRTALTLRAAVPRTEFETGVTLAWSNSFAQARALDASGNVIGTSAVVAAR